MQDPFTRAPRCLRKPAQSKQQLCSWRELGRRSRLIPQMDSPQVCPVTPNVTWTRSLPLGDCPTAQFSHQPGSFQKYIVHVHEQHRIKPTQAYRPSPDLSGLLCTTSAPGYQRGVTLPAAGPPLCKHGPKKTHHFFFFSPLLQSRGLRHFHKRTKGAGWENATTKFRGEYKLQMHNMNWPLSGAKPLQHFQTMRQQTTLAISSLLTWTNFGRGQDKTV